MWGTDEQKRLTASWLNIIGAGTISAGGVTQAVSVLGGDRVGPAALAGAAIAGGCLVMGLGVHLLARQVLSGVAEEDLRSRQSVPEGVDIGLSNPPKVEGRAPLETLMDEFSRRSADPDGAPQGLDSTPNPFLFCSPH